MSERSSPDTRPRIGEGRIGSFLCAAIGLLSVAAVLCLRFPAFLTTPELRTQTIISDLRYVVERLRDFYSPDETRLWLHSRHPLLNSERAIDLIYNDRTEEVLAVIERMDAGGYL